MQLLAAIVVLAASYGAGTAVTVGGRLPIAEGLRRRATIFALGFGFLELLALLLGVVHLFRPAALDPIALTFGAIGLAAIGREAPLAIRTWRSLGRLRWPVGATGVIVAFDAVLAMAPPTSADALDYHLTGPKLWLTAHEMYPVWWNWQTFQPFATEMHFAYAQALWNGASAVVVGAGLAGFSALCVYGLTRELAGRTAAAVAALLWVAQGMFLWEATGAFVELALSAFVVLTFWHLHAHLRTARTADATLAGVSLGIAASVKVFGLLFVPAVAFALLWHHRRRWTSFVAAATAAGAVAIPWYVRALVWTGNPIYPLLFGGKHWDKYAAADYVRGWQGYGIHGIWHLPFFPIEFLLQTNHYERGYGFGPALFLLPLVALVFRRRWVLWMATGEIAYLIVWWQGLHQITRYLLPWMAFAAILSGYGAVELWRRRDWLRRTTWVLGLATAVPFGVITALFGWQVIPGSLGLESTPTYVQRLTGTYDALQWLDTNLPPHGKVMIHGIRNLYWLNRPYMRETAPLFSSTEPQPVLIERMRAFGVRYFVGVPPHAIAVRSRLLAKLPVETVTSRTLGRSDAATVMPVYVWCAANGDPCSGNHSPASAEKARPTRTGRSG